MLPYPVAERVVIVGCEAENKKIDPLDFLLDLHGVFVDYLPSKGESNENCNDSDSREDLHDV